MTTARNRAIDSIRRDRTLAAKTKSLEVPEPTEDEVDVTTIPDAYRQEFLSGEAEDTAWIVDRGGSMAVPYGTLKNVLATLEATRLEPGAYDQKVYAPGIGIVREQALTGAAEFAELVSVSG